jgi:hypothetical protein
LVKPKEIHIQDGRNIKLKIIVFAQKLKRAFEKYGVEKQFWNYKSLYWEAKNSW